MRHPNHLPPSYPPQQPQQPQQPRKARSCNELGVCQRPLTCKGKQCILQSPPQSTDQTTNTAGQPAPAAVAGQHLHRIPVDQLQGGNVWFVGDEPYKEDYGRGTPIDNVYFWALCLVVYALALAAAGYGWHRYGDVIKALFFNLTGL